MRVIPCLGLFLGLAACGGPSDTDLVGNPGGADSGPDTSTRPDGTTGSDSSVADASVDDGPTIVDAPFFDVTPIVDSGPKDPGTLCFTPNASYCARGTELCCIKGPSSGACLPTNQIASCVQATRMLCDDSASCDPGNVCCGTLSWFNGNASYTEVKCAATCAVSQQIPGLRRFCDPKAPVDECKSIGLNCNPSNILTGYYVCN